MSPPGNDPLGWRFCPRCGGAWEPGTGSSGRCAACGWSFRLYPGVGVAVVLRDAGGRVLLGRRAGGRRAGLWCIPCGRVEWGEDVRAAARREFAEETGLEVELLGVYEVHSNFHDPDRLTVGIWFTGRVVGGDLYPRDGELSELEWFDPAEPPPLAFPTDALVLERLASEGRGQ